MTLAAYEAKFHILSRYATPPVSTKEERIHFYVKGLNTDLLDLSVHLTSTGKCFNEVPDYVKKIEGV